MTKAELEEEVSRLTIERDLLKEIIFKSSEIRAKHEYIRPNYYRPYDCPRPAWPVVGPWNNGQIMCSDNQTMGDAAYASGLMNADNQLTTLSN